MDLIDLTLDSEDESPPVASTSRLAPASVNNAQSQPRQPAAHSKSAGKSARKGLRLNATSSSRPRSGDKGNGKGKNRIEIEISDDDDLVNGAGPSRVGQHNGAAGGMRAAAHQVSALNRPLFVAKLKPLADLNSACLSGPVNVDKRSGDRRNRPRLGLGLERSDKPPLPTSASEAE